MFKKGDKVIMVRPVDSCQHQLGKVGIVDRVLPYGSVEINNGYFYGAYTASQFDLYDLILENK